MKKELRAQATTTTAGTTGTSTASTSGTTTASTGTAAATTTTAVTPVYIRNKICDPANKHADCEGTDGATNRKFECVLANGDFKCKCGGPNEVCCQQETAGLRPLVNGKDGRYCMDGFQCARGPQLMGINNADPAKDYLRYRCLNIKVHYQYGNLCSNDGKRCLYGLFCDWCDITNPEQMQQCVPQQSLPGQSDAAGAITGPTESIPLAGGLLGAGVGAVGSVGNVAGGIVSLAVDTVSNILNVFGGNRRTGKCSCGTRQNKACCPLFANDPTAAKEGTDKG